MKNSINMKFLCLTLIAFCFISCADNDLYINHPPNCSFHSPFGRTPFITGGCHIVHVAADVSKMIE